MRKTIFILITSGFSSRNVLYTEVFNVLKSSDHRLVFLVPPGTKNDYLKFEDEKIKFEEYRRPNWLEKKFSTFRLLNSFSQGTTFKLNTQTIRDKRRIFKEKGLLRFYILRLLTFLVSSGRIFILLRKCDWFLFKKQWVKNLFAKYEPSLIYSTDPLFFDEVYFLEYARMKNIKIVSQILSWDNLTNRGYMSVVPNKCIVWNNIMKEELLMLYNYPMEDVFVSGIPHFDRYFFELPVSREIFFNHLGLDLNKKLITFFTGSPANFATENISIKKIFNLLTKDKSFFERHQILLRLNPKDSVDRYADILSLSGVILKSVSVVDSRFRDNWNPKEKEVIELAATLKYSDLVVGMSSTICIESAIFDTPEVVLDMDEKYHYFYKMDHFQPIIKSGGVSMAYTAEEAVAGMKAYLSNRTLDKIGRERIVKEMCVFSDGESGKRVGNFILNNI